MQTVIARSFALVCWGTLSFAAALWAQAPFAAPSTDARQTETDEYTRYEPLAPESASFAIRYEVTAATPGANYFYNPIRKGSVASDESVIDPMTGQPLKFEVVTGAVPGSNPGAPTTLQDSLIVHFRRELNLPLPYPL